jgi:hypothetical protein
MLTNFMILIPSLICSILSLEMNEMPIRSKELQNLDILSQKFIPESYSTRILPEKKESKDEEFKDPKTIIPQYYLYEQFDKSYKIIVQHEFFRKQLKSIQIQEFENPYNKPDAKPEDFSKELKPKGNPKELKF